MTMKAENGQMWWGGISDELMKTFRSYDDANFEPDSAAIFKATSEGIMRVLNILPDSYM
jgi:hypothetical protein